MLVVYIALDWDGYSKPLKFATDVVRLSEWRTDPTHMFELGIIAPS